MKEIHTWPEVPSIAHFCSLFRQQFDLIEFEIEDFEISLQAMGRDGNNNDNLTTHLIVGLLKGKTDVSHALNDSILILAQ